MIDIPLYESLEELIIAFKKLSLLSLEKLLILAPTLKKLDLSGNNQTFIPDNFSWLHKLETLDPSNNNFFTQKKTFYGLQNQKDKQREHAIYSVFYAR